MPKQESI